MGDTEMASDAPKFLPARMAWAQSTRSQYFTFQASQAARALREEDLPTVKRCFDYIDRLTSLLTDPDASPTAIAKWQSMVTSVSKEIGLGPGARQALGIKTEVKPGSRLDAFRNAES